MTGSTIPALIDALIDTLTSALPGVLVVDGMGRTDTSAQQMIFVGLSDPDADSPDEAAAGDQEWPWLGHVQRAETIRVHMVALAWNGDGDQKRARDEAFGLVDSLAAAIQADPSLGGVVLAVSGITGMSLRQVQHADGATAYLPLDVTARAYPS